MSAKINELRIKVDQELKKKIEYVSKEILGLNLNLTCYALLFLGIEKVNEAVLQGRTILLLPISNSRSKKIIFEGKNDRK